MTAILGYLVDRAVNAAVWLLWPQNLSPRSAFFRWRRWHQTYVFMPRYLADGVIDSQHNLPTLVLARILGAGVAGGYNLAYNVADAAADEAEPNDHTRVLFPAFAKIRKTEKLRVNFYKLLSVVGIINFPALLGLMVVSNNFVPLVFGEKLEQHYSGAAIAVCGGAAGSVGNPIGSLLMAKARVDISFKFNVFKTFLFYSGDCYWWADGGRNRRHAWLPAGADYQHHSGSIVMIKPVLGPVYRQYVLSLCGCRFISSLPTLVVSYALGIVLKGQLALGMLLAVQIASGRAGVCGDDCAVAPSAGGGSEASVLSQRKNENAFTGGVNGCFRFRQRLPDAACKNALSVLGGWAWIL
ncbi:oligosaccharide flippase family protein [Escherichia coli]